MSCYFQGCTEKGTTREHIPPRSFFPEGEKVQLLTVRSCERHNNKKSCDDLYVLAQICMNASPNNRAREVFINKVKPQLNFNNGALRKRLVKGSKTLPNGAVAYQPEMQRLDDFFTALSCGIIFKTCRAGLPESYSINHIYHNFTGENSAEWDQLVNGIDNFYSGTPIEVLNFGRPDLQNERIYTVEIFGMPKFETSITIVHKFYGAFKVTSMLSSVLRQE